MNNSLAEVHPELITEWSEKNLPLTPDDITFGSNKKVWWKGVCKTTTMVNLGVGLAMQDKKVLLIDADLQGDLTTLDYSEESGHIFA